MNKGVHLQIFQYKVEINDTESPRHAITSALKKTSLLTQTTEVGNGSEFCSHLYKQCLSLNGVGMNYLSYSPSRPYMII